MTLKIETGLKRGNLTVIKQLPSSGGHRLFECLCKCGNSVKLRASHLADESRKHCGHQCQLLRERRQKVKVGDVFSRWLVLRDSGIDSTGNSTFECKCACGTVTAKVLAFNLVNGESTSCGCHNREIITKHGLYKDKEYRKLVAKKYRNTNPAKVKAAKIKYESACRKSTPKWLTKEHWEEMRALYLEARRISVETGVLMNVDHIIPIRGKTVSGLHVPWNLRVITAQENILKSNDIV